MRIVFFRFMWAYSSAWLERTPDKREVGGSSPPRPTNLPSRSEGQWRQGIRVADVPGADCRCVSCIAFGNTLTARRVFFFAKHSGALAQLGERLICIQEVRSSILLGSTIPWAGLRFDRKALPSALPSNRTHFDIV